jgi:hypothetical protein
MSRLLRYGILGLALALPLALPQASEAAAYIRHWRAPVYPIYPAWSNYGFYGGPVWHYHGPHFFRR